MMVFNVLLQKIFFELLKKNFLVEKHEDESTLKNEHINII